MVCGVLKLLVALTGITCRQPGRERRGCRDPPGGRNFKKLKNPVLRLTRTLTLCRVSRRACSKKRAAVLGYARKCNQ